MPSCPDPTISTRNLGLFADLQVTEVTNKITPRYSGEAKSQSPKGPSPSQRLTSPSLARAIVVDFGTSENGDFARCKSVQIGAKGRKNEPGLVASKDMGNNCACRWTIHENSGCNVLTFAIPGPIGPHRAPSPQEIQPLSVPLQ